MVKALQIHITYYIVYSINGKKVENPLLESSSILYYFIAVLL